MFKRAKKFWESFLGNTSNYKKLDRLYKKAMDDTKNVKLNIAQLQIELNNRKKSIENISEVEFQVFSQNGEDGIIQYIINKIDIGNKTFIEFGVENYLEANTRFLFINNNWTGYVIDGSQENIDFIEHNIASSGELYLQPAFITRENINDLLEKPGFEKEIGLLSIDIDGNDFWVWQEIKVINPIIIVAEYNSLFGHNTFWSVPYDPGFVRKEKHNSQLYYGASIQALCSLASSRGYAFIGSNSRGNNVFFVRNDKMTDFIKPKTPEEGYVLSKFREARDKNGWVTGVKRIESIMGLDVVDVRTGEVVKIDPVLVKYE